MPFGTITATESTFGSISGSIVGAVPGTLSGSVGVPGPQGIQGPVGPQGPQGVPGVGGAWGTLTGNLSAQTDLWTELGTKYPASNPSGFLTAASLSGYATESWVTGQGYITSAALTPYLLSSTAASTYYLQTNPAGYQTASQVSTALSPYLLSATASATYQTLSGMSDYLSKAGNLSGLASTSTARTNLGLGTMATASASDYSTTTVANGLYLTSSALTGYATQSFVAANYAPIAAGVPNGGTVGQVLTKNSGTDYDDSWQTLIPGDRYVTSSTTSNTVSNGAKTFTVGTGLSYSSQQDVVISYDAANHMHAVVTSYNSGTGVLVVDVKSHTGSGTYSSWTVNVGGTTPLQTVEWGEILGTLGDQSDLASALSAKLETSTAASTYAALAGATFTGEVVTPASTTSSAGLMISPGVAPTTPTNGEIWATTNDLQIRLNGVTETLAEQSWVTAQGYLTSAPVTSVAGRTGAITLAVGDVSGAAALAGATFTGLVNTLASSTAGAGFRLPHGAAPTTPVNGDIWTTTTLLQARINGANKTYLNINDTQTITGGLTFNGSATFASTVTMSSNSITLGNFTGASSHFIGTGATTSGNTKSITIGSGGAAGSTTAITVGNTTGSTTTLQGTTNGVTAAADTNSVALATTAYVVGQAGSATPLVDGTAAVGTSLRYARQDHVHPTDTSRAATASPTFTGTPLSTTAAVDTNTTQIATTAFVVGQAGSATPLVDGTAAVGTSLRYARADHVHPSDTTRLATANNLSELTATASTARTNIGLGTISTVNDAPSDGSTYGRNNGAWVVAGGGGGASTDYQAYETPGTFTWTKPAGAKWVEIIMFGAGGGGGSGGRYATSSGRAGGGGGGAGGFLRSTVPASALGATESVTVGAGGLGGASVTTDTTAGNNAPLGSNSNFSIYVALGGSGGGGGTTISSTQGSGRAGWFNGVFTSSGSNGSVGTTAAGNVASNTTIASSYMATGGAGGAGATASSTVAAAGATGGQKLASTTSGSGILNTIAGGAAGTTAGVSPTAGVSNTLLLGGGTGGGSGAYRTAVAGMAGANGGSPGGGGGGGSASDNGFASGAGGAGGAGAVYIITYS